MGVYLNIKSKIIKSTSDEALLEKLSFSQPGDFERLKALNAECEHERKAYTPYSPDWDKVGFEYFGKKADAGLTMLENFILFGWGRMTRSTYNVLNEYGFDTVCDSTDDITIMREIVLFQGIEMPEGVKVEDFEAFTWG